MASPRILSATNGFIPKATGQAIAYIRNPEKFKVNKYAQMIESPATLGVYYRIDRDTPARVVTDEEFAWEDGAERPLTNVNGLSFDLVEFQTLRRDYPTFIGNQALAMAKDAWKPLEHHTGALCQMAMTNRTNRILSMCETTSNWGNNTADANSLNGGAGAWDTASDDPASANFLAIKKAMNEAVRQIVLATNANVSRKELQMVISPGLAQAMASSAEIHSYLRNGPYSLPVLTGDKDVNYNEEFGLPAVLYGIPLIIEDTVRVTSRATVGGGTGTNATTNRVFAKSDRSAIITSRPGGLDGEYGAPSFSTIQVYWYEYQMAVFVFDDTENARTKLHVTEQFKEVLAAPESGYLITNCI